MSELKLQQCRLDGRYDVVDCLGRGSYSEVYVARDIAASNGSPLTVVIKALNTRLQGEPDPDLERTLVENFRNEAIALDRVRHPNIISRLGHGTAIDLQNRTFHYLVLEYLPGGDLQALCRQRPLALESALNYLQQVCSGLALAHRRGIIHRDIKPQNLLLTSDQRTVKIADFGVAKLDNEGLITRVGTDVYAAPEHHPLLHTGALDTASLSHPILHLTPAADIYSLAKTTYMLLSGEAPRRFSQKPITSLPQVIANQPWSEYVAQVLAHATRTNPGRRYQTVEEFWQELKDATMAKTRVLGDVKPLIASEPTPQPIAPIPSTPRFERDATPSTQTSRQRIVVPIATAAAELARPSKSAPPEPVRHKETSIEPPPEVSAYSDEPRFSSRTRSLLVAVFLLVAFAAMLFATRYYVQMRSPSGVQTRESGEGAPIGQEFLTIRDVNLRSGPSRTSDEIGVALKNSKVRVLQVNGRWYEVEILVHGRPKEDPLSAERGWLHSAFLRAG